MIIYVENKLLYDKWNLFKWKTNIFCVLSLCLKFEYWNSWIVNWDEFFVITAYSMAKCLQLRAIIANDPAYGTKYGCPNVLVLDVQLHKLTNEIVCKPADLLMSIWMCAVPSVPWKKAARRWLFYRCQNVGTQLRTLYLIDRIIFHKQEKKTIVWHWHPSWSSWYDTYFGLQSKIYVQIDERLFSIVSVFQ